MDQSTGQLISSAAIGAILVGAVQFFIKRFINRSDSTEELVRKIELRVKVLEENYDTKSDPTSISKAVM